MRNRRLATITATAGLVLVLGACGGSSDGKDDAAPKASATKASPTAGSTPLPKGLTTPPAAPDLTSTEEAAVKQAIAAYAAGTKAIFALEADPLSAVADKARTKKIVGTYYSGTYYDTIISTITRFADEGLSIEGRETQRWIVPTKVDLDGETPTIVLRQCSTFEKFRLVGQGAKDITVPETAISTVTMEADGGGVLLKSWKLADVVNDGKC